MHVLRQLSFKTQFLTFKYGLNVRNIELKTSKHIRRTCLRSVALEVEDTALIWMLTSAKKQNVPENAKMLS